jgi:hypothetical protein
MPRLQLKGVNLTPCRESFDLIEIALTIRIAVRSILVVSLTASCGYAP